MRVASRSQVKHSIPSLLGESYPALKLTCNMIPSDGMAPSSSQPTSSSQHTPVVANAGRRSVVLQVLGDANVTPGSVASATVSRNNLISSFGGKTLVSRV